MGSELAKRIAREGDAMSAAETLKHLDTWPEALKWVESHGGSLAEFWRDCPRGDWLMWYAARAGAPRTELVRAAAACAELALPCAGTGRKACEAAIAAARAWADAPGPETRAAARSAAYAAVVAGAAADAAARAAVYAANAAANAADAAGEAAIAAVDAAEAEVRAKCADVVRTHVPFRAVLP